MRLAVCAALALCAAGCPRLPPPAPRPSVVLERIERDAGGTRLRARLRVHNRGGGTLTLSAVDWELALGARPLLRGRSEQRRVLTPGQRAAVDLAIPVPAALEAELRRGAAAAGGRVELRGTVHIEDDGGRGRPAAFDELAPLP